MKLGKETVERSLESGSAANEAGRGRRRDKTHLRVHRRERLDGSQRREGGRKGGSESRYQRRGEAPAVWSFEQSSLGLAALPFVFPLAGQLREDKKR